MKSCLKFFMIYFIDINLLFTAVESDNLKSEDKNEEMQKKNQSIPIYNLNFSLIEYIEVDILMNAATNQIRFYNCKRCVMTNIDVYNDTVKIDSSKFYLYDKESGESIIVLNHIVPVNFTVSIKYQYIRESLTNLEGIFKNEDKSRQNFDNSLEDNSKSPIANTFTSIGLLVIFASKFTNVIEKGEVVKIWQYSVDNNKSKYASNFAIKANEFFTKFFFEMNPLLKSNLTIVSDSILDTTNVTLIHYRNNAVLYELNNDPSNIDKLKLASSIIHEWCNIYLSVITPNWKFDWTSMALATYLKYFGIAKIDGSLEMDRRFIDEHLQPILDDNELESSRPIPKNSNFNNDIEINKTIISKASSLIRMLHLTLGSIVFKNAAYTFFHKQKYQKVSADDLWLFFQDEIYFLDDVDSKLDIKTVMDSWIKQAGYPLLTVTINNSIAQLHQSRFVNSYEMKLNSTYDSKWWIPVTWTSQNTVNKKNSIPTYWLNKTEDKITLTDAEGWIIFNANRKGIYRVNYDDKSWENILKTLNSIFFHEIPLLNRVAIIDDLWYLAKIGLQPIEMALHGLEYIQRESSPSVIKVALKGLRDLHFRFYDSMDYEIIDNFIYSLLIWRYNYFHDNEKYLNDRSLLSLNAEISELIDSIKLNKCFYTTKQYYLQYVKTIITSAINQKSFAYCITVNKNLGNFGLINLNQLTSSSAIERPLTGLSSFCIMAENELARLFQQILKIPNEHKKISDLKALANCGNRGAKFVLDFLSENDDQIDRFCKINALATVDMISTISDKISWLYNIEALEALVNKKIITCELISGSLQQVIKKARYELNFYQNNRSSIVRWIKEYNYNFEKYNVYNFILPINIEPIHYAIKLIPHMLSGTFNGEVDIVMRILTNTNRIVLNIKNIKYETVSLESNSHRTEIFDIVHDKERDFLIIYTTKMLTTEFLYMIKIKYVGYLSSEKLGFYRDSYVNHLNQIKWFAVTNLELGAARRMFPCFDEPAFRATFQLSVSREANFKAVSNTKLNSTIKEEDRYVDIFEKTQIISTHQVALLLSEFSSVDEVSSYYAWMSEKFKFEFMYPLIQKKNFFEDIDHMYDKTSSYTYKYAHNFAQLKNQLENWGLVTYENNAVITNPDYVSVTEKIEFNNKWVYEMMYRFIANHVNMIFWRCEWSNVAFAQRFLSIDKKNKLSTKAEGDRLFVVHQLQPSMQIDALSSSRAISRNDYTPNQRKVLFDEITFDKSTSILRMIQVASKFKNSRTFFKNFTGYVISTKEFYARYMYRQSDDCFGIIQLYNMIQLYSFYHENTTLIQNPLKKWSFKDWIHQAGFPVLSVTIYNGTALLSQARFLINNDTDAYHYELWDIPITWTSSLAPDFQDLQTKNWMNDKTKIIEIDNVYDDDDSWIIFNIQQIGYYRVNYDTKSWNKIIRLLKSENFIKIHEINRASLLDDSFNLARAGLVNYSIVKELTEYLLNETSYTPWKAALNNLAFLEKRIADEYVYIFFNRYSLIMIEPIYKSLGFKEEENESYSRLLLRTIIIEWACKHGFQDCIDKSLRFFNNWKIDPSTLVPVNLRETIFCTSIKHGSKSNWEFLWNKYRETNYQNERKKIMKALACTENHEKLEILLSKAITAESEIRFQDSLSVFSAVYSSSSIGVQETFRFMTKQFDNILKYYKSYDKIKTILKGLTSHLTFQRLFVQFEQFIQVNGEKLLPIRETIISCVIQARKQLVWLDTYNATISDIFYE